MSVNLFALENIPLVKEGDDVSQIVLDNEFCLESGDIVLIAETLISKAEGNYIKIDDLIPSDEALKIAEKSKKDPKLVQAILNESVEVVEIGPDFVIAETRHGFVCANAAIDESNVEEGFATPVPANPDKSACDIRKSLEDELDIELAVIITDTQGRAFRNGAIGTAIGCSGIDPLWKRVGEKDLYGRPLETTEIATADELASAASLVMGQADEGLPIVVIRGFSAFNHLRNPDSSVRPLLRAKEFDVFRK